ncbi:uncharacterized protein LOC108134594 [Drosophila elegans]|uniref:uncharacterized protein LOC108134594 n=1 Tax=Drosophila elegans TaxID=30023 RepID=UPI0007E8A7EC|nr:uncharacterized protein LOC108134594 [Drosophila elegans]
MVNPGDAIQPKNDAPSDIEFYRAKVRSVLRQLHAMKDYLTAGATEQFDESDVLARLEWVNSMNLEFDSAQTSLEKLDFSEISKNTRFEFSAILMDLKAKLNRALAALRKLHLQDLGNLDYQI